MRDGTALCGIFCVILLLAASGCGLHRSTTASTTVSTTPPAATTNPHMPVPEMALTVYRVAGGRLAADVVHVPRTAAVAGAALRALGIDATVSISGGRATVDAPGATADQMAEVVWTLTQFPSVQAVDIAGRSGLTRDSFPQYTAAIQVDEPAAGATVASPIAVAGSAAVYEGTLVVQLVRDGRVVEKRTVTASAGAPERGTFSASLETTAGDATVQVFAPSQEDGSPQHEVDVPVTVAP